MNEKIHAELQQVNKITSVDERYKELRKLYCANKQEGIVAIAYATLLSTFSDNDYLKRALKICERILDSKNSRYTADAKLITYQIKKKLNPNQNITDLYTEVSTIESKDERTIRKIRFETVLLFEELFKKTNKIPYATLKKEFATLIKDCDPTEHALRNSVCAEYLSLLIHEKDYEEAKSVIDYMRENHYDLMPDFERTDFYIHHKLGMLTQEQALSTGYFENQIMDYDKNRAIAHIQKHANNGELQYFGITTFKEGIDLTDLFYEAEDAIQDMTPTESRYATDIYHICKDKPVGYIGKQEATVVEVIVESGTKNIHTMYPIILCNNNLYKKRSEAFIKGGKKR